MCILQRLAEAGAATGKFRRKSLALGYEEIGIPPHRRIAGGVGLRRGFAGLDEEHGAVTAKNGEERLLIRLLKPGLETEPVAVERDGLIDPADDEEGAHPFDDGMCHWIQS